jgi:hypothetical protein
MELFCFGTELGNSIAKKTTIRSQLIVKIKKYGKLTYALIGMIVPFWNELDYIGIDAYFPLSDAVTPTVAELKAWKVHILKNGQTNNTLNLPHHEAAKEP